MATTQRITAVSAATLTLCLLGGGVAFADVAPTPLAGVLTTTASDDATAIPGPGEIVTTVTDPVSGIVKTVVTTVTGQPVKQPVSAPDQQPKAPSSTPSQPSAATKKPAAAPAAPATQPVSSWSLPRSAGMAALMTSFGQFPELPSQLSAPAVEPPSVAGPSLSLIPTHVAPSTATPPLRESDGPGAVRIVLLALAAAAAGAVAAGHVGLLRGRRSS